MFLQLLTQKEAQTLSRVDGSLAASCGSRASGLVEVERALNCLSCFENSLTRCILSRCTTIPSVGIFANHADRKSVVEGKSVSVRVDPGGRRIIKKKKN